MTLLDAEQAMEDMQAELEDRSPRDLLEEKLERNKERAERRDQY